MIWTILNSLMALLIVPLALKVVKPQPQGPEWGEVPVLEAGALTVLFAISNACTRAIFTGQFALLVAVLTSWRCITGGGAGLGGCVPGTHTAKVNTMAPFLLLSCDVGIADMGVMRRNNPGAVAFLWRP